MARYELSPEFGFVREPDLAKIYILYLIRNMGGRATRLEVETVTDMAGRLNYFLAASSLADMVANGNLVQTIRPDGATVYTMTRLGKNNLDVLKGELPSPIRGFIDKATVDFLTGAVGSDSK